MKTPSTQHGARAVFLGIFRPRTLRRRRVAVWDVVRIDARHRGVDLADLSVRHRHHPGRHDERGDTDAHVANENRQRHQGAQDAGLLNHAAARGQRGV